MKSKISYQQAETRFQGTYQERLFRTLKLAYAPFIHRIGGLLILGFLGRFVLLFNTNLIGYWVDSFCTAPECRQPPEFTHNWVAQDYIFAISCFCLVGFVLTLVFRISFSRYSALAISRIHDEVTLRTSRFPLSFFDTTPTGRIITRFSSDYGNVFRLFGGPLAEFMALIFDLIVMVVLITIASPFYLSLVVVIVLLNYLVYRAHRDKIRKERRQLSVSRAPSIAHFAETAQGASSIRTYLRQSAFIGRFSDLNEQFLNQKLRTFRTLSVFSFQISSLSAALLLATGVISYYLLQRHLVSVGAIGVAFTFITLSGNTVQTFFEWLAQLDEALVGAERLDHYLHLPLGPGERLPASAEFPTPHWNQLTPALRTAISPLSVTSATIDFKNVSFRYREDLPWVLKDINFSVMAGEKLGIIGRTGSGKSSLISILFYLYPLSHGTITVNGLAPLLSDSDSDSSQRIELSTYRQMMTLIPQDPILFRGTLRENLSMNPGLSDERLLQSLTSVGLLNWFEGLPGGFNFVIEERGKNLSQGERQLLCLARCLLQDTPIVVMDEATSSVDPQSEQIMNQATHSFFRDRTQLIIAHRLSTLEHCDRLLWLHNGSIRMLGKPNEVLPIFLKINNEEAVQSK